MFNPTKSHERYQSDGLAQLKIGERVPTDAVSLAYAYAPPLKPAENIRIADTASFVLENMAAEGVQDLIMLPNENSLLYTTEGESYIQSRNFLLTDIFDGDNPLYYVHELQYPIVDLKSPDPNVFYTSTAIRITDVNGRILNSSKYRYKMTLIPTTTPNMYRIRIFTDFQTQPTDRITVTYTAVDGVKVWPGYKERLSPQPAYEKSDDLQYVVTRAKNELLYYQTTGKEIGQSRIYVPTLPKRDSVWRHPMPFRYRITAKATKGTVITTKSTPWIYDSVLNKDSLLSVDWQYVNGYKYLNATLPADEDADQIMTSPSALEILGAYEDITPFLDDEALVEVVAESMNPLVELYTQIDGHQSLLARTLSATGLMALPRRFEVRETDVTVPFQLYTNIDGVESTQNLKVTRTQPLVLGPYENAESITCGVTRPGFPVTVYVKDNCIYAVTNACERDYLPTYAVRFADSKQIKVESPAEIYPDENWYVRVKNGRFTRSASISAFPVTYRYMIPEYYRQDFTDKYGLPFRYVEGETPEVMGAQKIRVQRLPLYIVQEDELNLEVFVNGAPVHVSGWNAWEGEILLDTILKETDTVAVNYYYEERSYTYKGYYDEASARFWHLDLNPGYGHRYTDTDAITGEIVEVPTFQLINKTVYLYMKANAVYNEGNALVRGSYNQNVLFHTFDEIANPTDEILLAKIQVRPNSSLDSIQLIDTRSRGGGLKESITNDVMKKLNPESEFYWDIGYWDGEVYQENGVFIVRLPSYILRENGGKLLREEVEAIVKRHTGFGNLPIVEYVDEPAKLLDTPWTIRAQTVTKES